MDRNTRPYSIVLDVKERENDNGTATVKSASVASVLSDQVTEVLKDENHQESSNIADEVVGEQKKKKVWQFLRKGYDNPQNYSSARKAFILFIVSLAGSMYVAASS